MGDITVEELDPGVILKVVKPNGKTYQYSIPQYTPGSGGNGAEAKQTEIGIFCMRDDVVQVVRCKDCKYYRESRVLAPIKFCFRLNHPTEPGKIGYNFADDDFCSHGERKDGADAEG